MARHRTLISVSSGWGASDMGTGAGPLVITHSINPIQATNKRFDQTFFDRCHHIENHPAGIPEPRLSFTPNNTNFRHNNAVSAIKQTYDRVLSTLKDNSFPFVLGGDHSIAVGTWSALKTHLNQDFGLIWIDAHLDAHTPDTSPSQARHGMPLAALLGYGDAELITLGSNVPKLKPENIVIMGARSFEEGEFELLTRLNVRIMHMDEIFHRGFDTCFQEALTLVTSGNKAFGVSFDIDGFDASIVPGTGTPEPGGLDETILVTLNNLLNHDKLVAFELVEFNPRKDKNSATLKLIWKLVSTLEGAKQWTTVPQQKLHHQ